MQGRTSPRTFFSDSPNWSLILVVNNTTSILLHLAKKKGMPST